MNNTRELISRFLTAIFLVAFTTYAVFYLPFKAFLLGSMGLMLWAGWEWSYLSGYTSYKARVCYVLLVYFSLLLGIKLSPFITALISGVASMIAVIYVAWLISIQTPISTHRPRALIAGLGLLSFSLCWHSLIRLKFTPSLLGASLLIIIMTDTLGYFVGRYWGKHLLAPHISPKKTWEGFLASLLSPFILVGFIFNPSPYPKIGLLVVGIVTTLAAIAGDLLESLVKRQQGVKDSGHLFPGHGGLLDRLDSILLAVPAFTASLYGIHHFS